MRFNQLLLVFVSLLFVLTCKAQEDSTQYVHYDIIYLTKGGALKGEILSLNEETGIIIFKDTRGVKYTLGKDDYKYFIEDKAYPVKKQKTIKPRKEDGFEFHLGFNASFVNIRNDISPDETFLSSSGTSDLPFCLKLGAGKYFTRNHFAGITSDFALASYGSYFSIGARYTYQYDAYKRNVAFYIPIELSYNHIKNDENFTIDDTLYIGDPMDGSWLYPITEKADVTLNNLVLNVGQGFSFILNNRKSIAIELTFSKYFNLGYSYQSSFATDPKSNYNSAALRLGVIFNI